MAPRKPVPPPIRCRGTARSTGEGCRRWAIPGSLVCKHHGGFAGRSGRAHAEDLHEARRTEAVVTAQVGREMVAAGWSPDLLAAISDSPPRPSSVRSPDDAEERAMAASMRRIAERFASGLAGALVGSLRPDGPVPPAEPRPAEPDPVAEDIARLEARPTARRMAEAARLRQAREHQSHALTLHGRAADPEPEPPSEPEPVKPGRRTTTLGSRPDGTINRGVRP